ncbi:MAG: hypothetical protein LBS62_09565 [Clostridiales bacterium]|jgi:hypothetical protein|nr:hypothetical protein [Clostridiales bacterium]
MNDQYIGKIRRTFEYGEGVFQLAPAFVTRRFNLPGCRLRIHPDDYYAYGTEAGAIMERWFSSVNRTRNNNPGSTERCLRTDEGLSYLYNGDGELFLLKDAVALLKGELIGEKLQDKYGTWPIFAKFFDYQNPLYFHFHPGDAAAKRVGCAAKPECYYFPPQLNNYLGTRPSTYFGFNPKVTKEDVREKLARFRTHDTKITAMSRAFGLELGTGWYVPPGVLHAPGSLLTYEPQWGTDLNCVFENVVCGEVYDEQFLYDICPEYAENKLDYIMEAVDWEKNYDPDFKEHYFRPPVELPGKDSAVCERWICYGNDYITAKEVTISPNSEAVLTDKGAYGCVIIQGFGEFGVYRAEAVAMMRFGDLTKDEYFVSKDAARRGVRAANHSLTEPMVILQHFGPDNAVYV